jgi:AcrR family transcriptional regulator
MGVPYTQFRMAVKRRTRGRSAKPTDGGFGRQRSVDLLWGSRERPSRGPKPGLNLDAIVDAAIHVVEAEGLAALTMARIAEELKVTTMALYRYVPGKDELIDLMIDAALGTPPALTGQDWRSEVGQWVRADLAVFRRHPWLLQTTISRVPIGPNWLAWLESLMRALSGTSLRANEQISVALLVDGHARSAAEIALGVTSTPQWAADFGRVLGTVMSDNRFSALAGVATAGGFEKAGLNEHFEFGLQRLLDGIDAFVRADSSQRRKQTQRRSRV